MADGEEGGERHRASATFTTGPVVRANPRRRDGHSRPGPCNSRGRGPPARHRQQQPVLLRLLSGAVASPDCTAGLTRISVEEHPERGRAEVGASLEEPSEDVGEPGAAGEAHVGVPLDFGGARSKRGRGLGRVGKGHVLVEQGRCARAGIHVGVDGVLPPRLVPVSHAARLILEGLLLLHCLRSAIGHTRG